MVMTVIQRILQRQDDGGIVSLYERVAIIVQVRYERVDREAFLGAPTSRTPSAMLPVYEVLIVTKSSSANRIFNLV